MEIMTACQLIDDIHMCVVYYGGQVENEEEPTKQLIALFNQLATILDGKEDKQGVAV